MNELIEMIRNAVSEEYGVSVDDMNGTDRNRDICHARHVAMFAVRTLAEVPFKKLGWIFGGRDHTTAIHACKQVQSLITPSKRSAYMVWEGRRVEKLLKEIRAQIEAETSVMELDLSQDVSSPSPE